MIGFVTNGSFLKSAVGSGIRDCLAEEFTSIYCLDLRGNQRTQGEISKKEGGKIFGQGSRASVAITFLVKNPKKKGCKIYYKDIGDNLTKNDKLSIIKSSKSISGILDWKTIIPDKHHDWLDQRDEEFDKFIVMGNKKEKQIKSIFNLYSAGVSTARDYWTINSSKKNLLDKMKTTINFCHTLNLESPDRDPKKIKLSATLLSELKKAKPVLNQNAVRRTSYRPFFKQWLYFDSIFNESHYQINKIFPHKHSDNKVICISVKTDQFSVFFTDIIPNLDLLGHTQCFPRYTYENNKKQDNILDSTLKSFQKHYRNHKITKDDIFYYVYGVLHLDQYRTKYAANLKKQIPHIPMLKEFEKFVDAGYNLAELHLNYDTGKQFKLKYAYSKSFDKGNPEHYKVKKIKTVKNDKNTLIYNNHIRIDGIPDDAHKYRIKGRTPLEWIVDRYKVKTDKDSGITNDPNDWFENPQDLLHLIERIVYLSVETAKIIQSLPKNITVKEMD